MKTRFAFVLLLSFAAFPIYGQQANPSNQPLPSRELPRTIPGRIQLHDASQFRSLRSVDFDQQPTASQQQTGGISMSLGDESSAPYRQSNRPTGSNQFQQASYTQPQEDNRIPSILTGNQPTASNGTQQNHDDSSAKPAQFSMTQEKPPVSRSPIGRMDQLHTNPPVDRSTSGQPSRFQGDAFNPSMPMPGESVDLRTANAIPSQNISSEPVQTVTARQDEQETLRSAQLVPGTAADSGLSMSMDRGAARDHGAPVISAPGASIQVSTIGPKSISVGKNATYEITVVNNGSNAARALTVTFSTPDWIEIANTSLTTGIKEVVRESDSVRILWRLDRLEPGQAQRLVLDVIPRKAQIFDLNVEWSLAPVSGAVQVQVTEPMVKMTISGPDEVQFGQTAVYNVSIRNPGTGVAENVNVSLSEALGGERAALGNLAPGEEKTIQVELIARSAGSLELSAMVSGENNVQDAATRKIIVRRPQLAISVAAPTTKYAGTVCNYRVTIENTGDAMAQDIVAAMGLPAGVQYVSGVEAAETVDGGLRWQVGSLMPGAKREYKVACMMGTSGTVQLDVAVRGAGDLADATTVQTDVQTVADLVLTVEDPKGPMAVGEDVVYQIRIQNRGTRTAENIETIMHFANGIEPIAVEGIGHQLNPGEVAFDNIARLDAGSELLFRVVARAAVPGAHAFRVQVNCEAADARELAGGTTRFVGDEMPMDESESAEVVSEQAVPELTRQ